MTDCTVRHLAHSLYLRIFGKCHCADTKSEQTRDRILEAAFEEMYINGFQGMRVEHILAKTQLTKGAFYHHFPSKKSLGYAVVDDILFTVKRRLLEPLEQSDDPITTCLDILSQTLNAMSDDELALGCPLNNLSQEMSSIDQGFAERLSAIYMYWQKVLQQALTRGQQAGTVATNIDSAAVSLFIISSIQGIIGTVKCLQNKQALGDLNATLADYLKSLAPNYSREN